MRRDVAQVDATQMLEWCATVCDQFVDKFVDDAGELPEAQRDRALGKADGALLIAEALRTFGGVKIEAESSPTVKDTIAFVMTVHAGQFDKIGKPYWQHPLSVMTRIPDASEHEKLVALLHDVLEDTPVNALQLLKMGYPFDVVWDVNTLTKHGNFSYETRIKTIAALGSRAAIRVKIADIEDNLAPERFSKLQEQDQSRLSKKYAGAIDVLTAALAAKSEQVSAS